VPSGRRARRGEEGGERLHAVGRQRHDPVAPADTGPHESGAGPADEVAQLPAGHLAVVFVREDGLEREVGIGAGRECVLRVVQRGPREPLGAGHLGAAEHGARLHVEPDAEELGHRRPETLLVVHRPGVQRGVVGGVDAAVLADPLGELGQPTVVVGIGGPQDVGSLGAGHTRSMHSEVPDAPEGALVSAGGSRTS
jgi:hypothetical protein